MPSRRVVRAAWPQAVAVLTGVLFVVLGVMGFGATGIDGFAEHNDGEVLFGLAVNPLHNLLHVAVGIAGIVLSSRLRGARLYGWVLVAVFGAVFAYGAAVARAPQADVLNTNWPVNWLHLAFAVLGLVIAVAPATPRPVPEADPVTVTGTGSGATVAGTGSGATVATAATATPAEGSGGSVGEAVAEPRERLSEQT